MPDTADRAQANPDSTRLIEAAREARDDAAPSALTAGGALVLLALVGRHAGWELLGHQLWWIWVVVAFPYLLLAAVLLLGLARLVKHDHRREIVIGLLSLVWGFNVSTVINWHVTFMINSLTHMFGRRRYPTKDDSRNSFILAILTLGEGWHNNHHYYQASTRQGFFWWEIDITYYLLKGLAAVGLIWDLREPPAHVVAGRLRPAA